MSFDLVWGGLHKVISGGQTGADLGGLRAAKKRGILTGGTAPDGYKTADGPNLSLESYGLVAAGDYNSRTKRNIHDSSGTVIIAHNMSSPGTVLTRRVVRQLGKPLLELSIFTLVNAALAGPSPVNERTVLEEVDRCGIELAKFIEGSHIDILNVAGNRELKVKGADSIVSLSTEWIVDLALHILETKNKVILKKDLVDF